MEDKRREEEEEGEEVGGATEGTGPVGRNILPQEAANHRSHRHLRLITITNIITIIIITTVERMVARGPSQKHRCV